MPEPTKTLSVWNMPDLWEHQAQASRIASLILDMRIPIGDFGENCRQVAQVVTEFSEAFRRAVEVKPEATT